VAINGGFFKPGFRADGPWVLSRNRIAGLSGPILETVAPVGWADQELPQFGPGCGFEEWLTWTETGRGAWGVTTVETSG